jgi:outer membrane protein OmpA-like peptidoglycan-associated protein
VLRRADSPSGEQFYIDEIVFDNGVKTATPTVSSSMLKPVAPVAAAEPVVEPVAMMSDATPPERTLIPFESAKTAFNEMARAELDKIVTDAAQFAHSQVVVEGHTDSVGPASLNLTLSKQRAQSVADYLIAHGLDPKKVVVTGYGEERLLAPGDDKSEGTRRQNRRVEIILYPQGQ